MKKLILFVVTLLMLASFAGCSDISSTVSDSSIETTSEFTESSSSDVVKEVPVAEEDTATSIKEEDVNTSTDDESEIGSDDSQTSDAEDEVPISTDGSSSSTSTEPGVTEPPLEDPKTEPDVIPQVPTYTFIVMSGIKYPSIELNVRSMPDTTGDMLGTLAKNQEVAITGQCNETGWYRFDYGATIGYASNKYLLDQKTADPVVTPGGSGNSGPSVTVPDVIEEGTDLVWIPINGGTKYHSRANCSKMKDPIQVPRSQAIENGYTPCKKCNP